MIIITCILYFILGNIFILFGYIFCRGMCIAKILHLMSDNYAIKKRTIVMCTYMSLSCNCQTMALLLNETWKTMHTLTIDLLHKSHNTSVPYPTMHHFVTEMCTCVHISVTKWCIVGYLYDALWDLWNGSIESPKIYFELIKSERLFINKFNRMY